AAFSPLASPRKTACSRNSLLSRSMNSRTIISKPIVRKFVHSRRTICSPRRENILTLPTCKSCWSEPPRKASRKPPSLAASTSMTPTANASDSLPCYLLRKISLVVFCCYGARQTAGLALSLVSCDLLRHRCSGRGDQEAAAQAHQHQHRQLR